MEPHHRVMRLRVGGGVASAISPPVGSKRSEWSMPPDRIIRLPEVIYLTGESRTAIYAKMAAGRFPPRHKLGGGRSVGWSYLEVVAYIEITLAGYEYIAPAMCELSAGHDVTEATDD